MLRFILWVSPAISTSWGFRSGVSISRDFGTDVFTGVWTCKGRRGEQAGGSSTVVSSVHYLPN